MFLAAIIHGSLWIRNDLAYNLPILSEEKEGSGIRAFACLGLTVVLSLKPVRKFLYQGFFFLQYAFTLSTKHGTWILDSLAWFSLSPSLSRYVIIRHTLYRGSSHPWLSMVWIFSFVCFDIASRTQSLFLSENKWPWYVRKRIHISDVLMRR